MPETIVASPCTCSRSCRECTSPSKSDQLLVEACGTTSRSKLSLVLSPSSSGACKPASHNGVYAATESAAYDRPRHVVHRAVAAADPAAEATNRRPSPPGDSEDAHCGVRKYKRMSLSERIDAQMAGYDNPLQLAPEGQVFLDAVDAEAGRVSCDFAAPLRLDATDAALRQAKIWSVMHLFCFLIALMCTVTLFHHMVDKIESTSARGLGLLCDAASTGVAGAGHVGVCKGSFLV